jgi:flagellar biosynthesis protein
MSDEDDISKAVALSYDGKRAPFVAAAGDDDLADMIIRVAKIHEIPIYENKALVDILSRLEIGEEIPEVLYRTIAEIIAFVYMLKGKSPAGFKHQRKAREKEVRDSRESRQLPVPVQPGSGKC